MGLTTVLIQFHIMRGTLGGIRNCGGPRRTLLSVLESGPDRLLEPLKVVVAGQNFSLTVLVTPRSFDGVGMRGGTGSTRSRSEAGSLFYVGRGISLVERVLYGRSW